MAAPSFGGIDYHAANREGGTIFIPIFGTFLHSRRQKARHKPVKNPTKPRFFERSRPNQLWQSDIMTLRLVGRNAFNFLAAKGHLERGSSV